MKKLLVLSLVVFSSMVAADQAQASRPGIIAEVVAGGGLFPMPAQGIRIQADGTVLAFGKRSQKVLAKLNASLVEQIVDATDEIKAEELVDLNPEQPGCMDAPTTTYSIRNTHGQVNVAQQMQCKEFVHPDYRATGVIKLLEGFLVINRSN